MKQLVVILIVMLLSCGGYAQQFKEVKPVSKAKVSTTDNIVVGDKKFTCYVSSGGCYYLERVSSSTGKAYKSYLGYKTKYLHKGYNIFTNKDETKYWYLALNKNGYPKQVALEKL